MLGLNISDDLARRRIIAGPATDTTNGPIGRRSPWDLSGG